MKKSSFLARIEAQKQAEKLETHRFTRQLMVDLSFIALNSELGLGAERLKKYANRLEAVYGEYADLWNSDDQDTEYSREKLDEKLKQIFGDDFHPWTIRYGSESKREA